MSSCTQPGKRQLGIFCAVRWNVSQPFITTNDEQAQERVFEYCFIIQRFSLCPSHVDMKGSPRFAFGVGALR
jgi:hypothetical protein